VRKEVTPEFARYLEKKFYTPKFKVLHNTLFFSPYTLQTNEHLGSIAIALPVLGLMLHLNYDHALSLLLDYLLFMVRSFC
jgi:hypothetical protein